MFVKSSMNLVLKEKQDIREKVRLMINDGITVELPVENHVNNLEQKSNLFSDMKYHQKERKTIDFIKSLDNPNRLRIIQLLKGGVKCSCELEFALNLSQPTISHHIKILENANVVEIISKGKWKLIKLIESPVIFWVLDQLK